MNQIRPGASAHGSKCSVTTVMDYHKAYEGQTNSVKILGYPIWADSWEILLKKAILFVSLYLIQSPGFASLQVYDYMMQSSKNQFLMVEGINQEQNVIKHAR